jgi:hypothetical protein
VVSVLKMMTEKAPIVSVGHDKVQLWDHIPPQIATIPLHMMQFIQTSRGNSGNCGIFVGFGKKSRFLYLNFGMFSGSLLDPFVSIPVGLLLMDVEPKKITNGSWWVRSFKSWNKDRDDLFNLHSTDLMTKRGISGFSMLYTVLFGVFFSSNRV